MKSSRLRCRLEGAATFVPHISIVRKSSIDDRGVESELAAMLARQGPIACACRESSCSKLRWSVAVCAGFALSGGRDIPSPGLPEVRIVSIDVVIEVDSTIIVSDRGAV